MTSRFALSDHEKGILAITYITDGQWTALSLTREEGASFLLHFFKSLLRKDDPEEIAKEVYLSMQNTLMAYRKDDFILIQSEPPFSPFSKQNFTRLLKSWYTGGELGFRDQFYREVVPIEP